MQSTKPLQGGIALVTGVGRLAGIGAAICRAIATNGGNVFFTYWQPYDKKNHPENSESDPAAIATELSQLGVRVGSLEFDLALPDSAEKLFQAVENELGTPGILINNACHDFEVPFVELSPEILDQHYAVNVRAVAMLCKEFLKKGTTGHIINMTSGQSLGTMGGHKLSYTITKAALEMIALQLAPELAKLGISIHAIDPGPTDTGWMTEDLKEQIRKESRRGKVNSPEDVARLVISLLTEKKYPTGEVIHLEREGRRHC
jgi:3-oxoacyl-[acyl-carrier protein] reductase